MKSSNNQTEIKNDKITIQKLLKGHKCVESCDFTADWWHVEMTVIKIGTGFDPSPNQKSEKCVGATISSCLLHHRMSDLNQIVHTLHSFLHDIGFHKLMD